MTLEEWKTIIDSGSSVWIAGMSTVQALAVVATLFLAYKQYESFLLKKFRSHALKILNQDLKLIEFQSIIFDEVGNYPDFSQYEKGLFDNLEIDFKFVFVKTLIYKNQFSLVKNDIVKAILKIERNVSVLNDEKVKILFLEKKKYFEELEKTIKLLYVQFGNLVHPKPPLDKSHWENQITNNYNKIKKLIGSSEDLATIPFGIVIPASGLNLVNKKIEIALEKHL